MGAFLMEGAGSVVSLLHGPLPRSLLRMDRPGHSGPLLSLACLSSTLSHEASLWTSLLTSQSTAIPFSCCWLAVA